MIFLGDIASPTGRTTLSLVEALNKTERVFLGKRIVCNLEGLVSETDERNGNTPVLFNHSSVLKALDTGIKPVCCLANNHILDLPETFRTTISLFGENNIHSCGAGWSAEEADEPAIFKDEGHEIILFSTCWDFLLYNHKNPSKGVFVSTLNAEKIIEQVKQKRKDYPEGIIIVFLHWSLDLETLPFPMYRVMARELIDAGARMIVGSHSHCVQGGEKYKDGYVVYGLGNFFMPHHHFINGRLVYPPMADEEMALEFNPHSGEAISHWFRYVYNEGYHGLTYVGSDKFEDSERLAHYSPYRGMNDREYLAYFRKNRRKKILIPVFTNPYASKANSLKTLALKTRARFAHQLATLGVIKWGR